MHVINCSTYTSYAACTVNSCLADTVTIGTAAKSQAKISYRCLTEINSRYYGHSPMRTPDVRFKGS